MMKKILLLLMLLSSTMLKAQDVIVMNDGSTIICKVIEIGTTEVKYKKYSNLDGPLYSILRSDIQNVNFENGEREIIFRRIRASSSAVIPLAEALLLWSIPEARWMKLFSKNSKVRGIWKSIWIEA